MIYNSLHYLEQGILKAPLLYQLVLGAAGGTAATIENLVYLKGLLPPGANWSAFGVGKAHIPIMLATLALGGHIRVGMEDNVYFAPKKLAESNAQLVSRAVSMITIAGKAVASPDDARRILNLKRN